jgi:transaldolase
MHIVNCAKIGADVMTGPLSAIYGLLKHPLTDIGLAQFVADFEKGNSNYFILKAKGPFRSKWALF